MHIKLESSERRRDATLQLFMPFWRFFIRCFSLIVYNYCSLDLALVPLCSCYEFRLLLEEDATLKPVLQILKVSQAHANKKPWLFLIWQMLVFLLKDVVDFFLNCLQWFFN